jgi:hypothetical protein
MTDSGPRSRTLASFRTLTPSVVERARERASSELSEEAIRRAALRGGAPIAMSEADAAAASLLRQIGSGNDPAPALRRMVVDALPPDGPASDAERAVAPWIAATPEERGATLVDLLLLTDKLPRRPRPALRFPRVDSSTA